MLDIEMIKETISKQHEGDERQLSVIFSEQSRVIVEAPAGYGKTTTMISRIAYLFASGKIPNPKRILGLTFSVNAALKVKREISEKLPILMNAKNNPTLVSEKATVTNYHGFCKSVLKKYGYLLTDTLRKDINVFKAIGDNEISSYSEISSQISVAEQREINKIEEQIKIGVCPKIDDICSYNDLIAKHLLPMGYIKHNAVILFTLELYNKCPEVRSFYHNYYPLIIVDEFQDTNSIAWELLKYLISEKTQLLFLGDPLQRIYGFIGALPNIMDIATEEYQMAHVTLNQNYRFRNNKEMLKLDANIRFNAQIEFKAKILTDIAELSAFWGKTQEDESEQVVDKIQGLLNDNVNTKIAILCRGRNQNSAVIENELAIRDIKYFYGMFTDEDKDYVSFHIKCQELFISRYGKSKSITKKSLISFTESVKKVYDSYHNKTISSLIALLEALVEKVAVDYASLSQEEKYTLLMDIFENRQLKQAMEYVDANVIITTIHGAKGLEWEYVFLPDVERWIFPNFYTCKDCLSKFLNPQDYRCTLPDAISNNTMNALLDELSVFYVGVTRARKQVYVSASGMRYNNDDAKSSLFSCLVNINGIKLVDANKTDS